MRLIDVDALEHELMTKRKYLTKDQVLDAAYVVNKAPAIDAVPVVRCKECKHWHEETSYCEKHSYFIDSEGVSCSPAESPNWTMWDADDFCSDGVRKEG